MTVILIILIVLLCVALHKWFWYRIALLAYIRYMEDKHFSQPSDAELNRLKEWAVRNSINDLFGKKVC